MAEEVSRRRSPGCMECGRCDADGGGCATEELDVERVVREVVRKVLAEAGEIPSRIMVPVGVSARHVHLTPQAFETLYGPGRELTHYRDLLQPGQFAAKETVTIVGPRMRAIENVRILGPFRDYVQVELSRTDGFALGLDLPIGSGKLPEGSWVTLIGPHGSITLREGVIRANRHIHIPADFASKFGLRDGEIVKVVARGAKETVFGDVLIRIGNFVPELHLDTDDANAADLSCGDEVEILKDGKI